MLPSAGDSGAITGLSPAASTVKKITSSVTGDMAHARPQRRVANYESTGRLLDSACEGRRRRPVDPAFPDDQVAILERLLVVLLALAEIQVLDARRGSLLGHLEMERQAR